MPRVYIGVLCCWLCVVLAPCIAAFQPQDMYLNSRANCGHGDSKPPWHKVDKYSLYRIRDDVSPDTDTTSYLTNCDMVFRSINTDGRLCVYQRTADFVNNNVELRLYDGYMDVDGKHKYDKLMSTDKELGGVEWCTSGRFLTVELQIRAVNAVVKDTVIDILVYHISSIHRNVYMDTSPSCGSTIQLDYSQVNVSNLDMRNLGKEIHWRCTLHFEYIGTEENRSLCMLFQPVGPRCIFNYSLSVFDTMSVEGSHQKVLSHKGGCHKPMPKRWCSNSTKMTLKLEREEETDSYNSYEKEVLFHALILDHQGGVETLPVLFSNPENTPAEQFTTIIVVTIIVGVLSLILTVIIAMIVWRRRQAKRSRDPTKANGEACGRMLPGRAEQTRNGGNHYTEGTRPRPEDV